MSMHDQYCRADDGLIRLCCCRGYMFHPSLHKATGGRSRHKVELERFHQSLPQPAIAQLSPSAQIFSLEAQKRTQKAIPFPSACENPIVISDCAVMYKVEGTYRLQVR